MSVRPPWWTLASALAAPILLIGGWAIAQQVQPPGYSPIRDTISSMARSGLDHRWIMTVGLAGLGLGHLVTAFGLHGVRIVARLTLGIGGLASALVAIFSQPPHGSSNVHLTLAGIGFVALVLCPALSITRRSVWVLRPLAALGATAMSAGLLAWLAVTLGGNFLGLSERVLTAQQALWPVVVVLALRLHRRIVDRHAGQADIRVHDRAGETGQHAS